MINHDLQRNFNNDHSGKNAAARCAVGAGCLILSLLLTGIAPVHGEVYAPSGQTVATVNGVTITRDELDREIGRLQRRSGNRGEDEAGKELRRQALEGLVDRELLWQESRREGIQVPEEEVLRELAVLRKSVPSSLELGQVLRENNLSPEAVRREVERRVAVMALLKRRLGERNNLLEEEIRHYYERHPEVFRVSEKVRLSQILVRIDPRWHLENKDEARRRIGVLRDRLRLGEDFAALARESSECPGAAKGGDLGWFGRGSLTPRLEAVAFTLPTHGASDILEDRYGFHLIRVTGRKAARTVPYSEARPKIVQFLLSERIREEGLMLARELRRRSKVEAMPEKE
jgi:peptidyl-prolyl cis-trans isomerase C